MVASEYDRLRTDFPTFCGCDLCKEDVYVYALNRLSPRYVTQNAGEVIERVSMEGDQERASVAVVLMEGFRRVQASPRDGHPAPSPGAGGRG